MTGDKEYCIYQFGPFRLDAAEHILLCNGRRLSLTPKAFEILLLLIQNNGHVLEKEELLKEVWPDAFVEEGNLARQISTLRKVLSEGFDSCQYIETVPRRGYRFVASVKIVLSVEAGKICGELVSAAHGETMEDELGATKYLAVMPFTSENGDLNTQYLSEGITESLIDSLSLLPQVKVMARATVYRYKGQAVDPYDLGQKLGVKDVLVGRLLLLGETLVVSAELTSVEDRSHIWGARYERRLSDLFFLQEEIARAISESLRVRLSSEETKSAAREFHYNPEPYLSYLKGRYFWNKRSIKGTLKAVEYFRKSIELDPGYALAQIGLADCYILLADFGMLSPNETKS